MLGPSAMYTTYPLHTARNHLIRCEVSGAARTLSLLLRDCNNRTPAAIVWEALGYVKIERLHNACEGKRVKWGGKH